ncbi:MAG: DoxX family membrane protein [Bacillota bacterium]
MSKTFTLEELKKYNGLKGQPAYVAYKGRVYDVSQVFQNGEHAGVKAGTDLTELLAKSPHDESIFSKVPQVGTLQVKSSCCQKLLAVSEQRADLLLRIGLGTVFFAHGAQKLLGWFGGFGWSGTMGFLTQALGIPAFFAGLAILTEFFGGLAILLGLFTRLAGLGLAITMLVAMFKVHWANGFFLDLKGPADGIEYAFVLFWLAAYFAVKGAGRISLDYLLARRSK